MNIETGEIKDESELTVKEKADCEKNEAMIAKGISWTKGKHGGPRWVSLTIGEIIEVKGVPCKLTHVNPGRRRITLTALGTTNVPEPVTDPVVRSER